MFPQILDKVDADEMLDEFADGAGVAPKIILSNATVMKIREAKAAEAAARQKDALAASMVEGAKSLSETSTEPGNVLGDMAAAAAG